MDLEEIRRDYLRGGLRRGHLAANPIEQFQHWLQQAIDAGLKDPTAMTVATVNTAGDISQRIVLLKHVDSHGFVFYTNYASQKARDISEHAKVSLHFPWHMLERQVKIQGVAEKVSHTESLKYFLSRPRESQLAAWASAQSQRISSRDALLMQFKSMREKFKQGEIPLPDQWGGYRIRPQRIEFWQGGANRLHDRFEYTYQDNEQWAIERLAP